MTSGLWLAGGVVAIGLLGWLVATPIASAQKTATAEPGPLVTWEEGQGGQSALIIDVTGRLSKKQRSLIDSGFTAYSELKVKGPETLGENGLLIEAQCTVKYDTWEERYDLVRLDEKVSTIVAADYRRFANLCLKARIDDPQLITSLSDKGGLLKIELRLNQVASEKAGKIREWLIKQQSGVMQGLFSHMLGELKVSEELALEVEVLPRRARAEMSPTEVIAIYPSEEGKTSR